MNKRIVLVAVLLVNMVMAVSGTDFEERITEKSGTGTILTRLFTGKTGTS